MSHITLGSPMQNNLLALNKTTAQLAVIQNRLSTGLKVNSAIENASSYYTSKALSNRASDLDALLNSMGKAIQTVSAAKEGIKSATGILEQMRSVTEQTLTEAAYVTRTVEVEYDHNVEKLLAQGYQAITSSMTVAEIQAILDTDNAKVVLTEDVSLNSSLSFHGKNIVVNGGGHTFSSRGIYNYSSGATFENMKLVNTANNTSSYSRTIYDAGGKITIRNIEILQENTIAQAAALELRGTAEVENVNIMMSGEAEQMVGVYVWNESTVKNVSVRLSGSENSLMTAVGSHSNKVSIQNIGVFASGGTAYGVIGPIQGISSEAVGEGSRPSALYDGKANTDAIVGQIGTDGVAAYAASQFYVGNKGDADFGQGTWYLPSMGELMDMYGTNYNNMTVAWGSSTGAVGDNKRTINNALAALKSKGAEAETLSNGYYWSSSEYSNYSSWVLYMGYGYRNYYYKTLEAAVRCFQLVENCFSPFNSSAGGSGAGGGVSGAAAPKIGDVMYADKTWGSADDYDGSKEAVGIITEVMADDGSVKIVNLKDLTFSSTSAVGNFNPEDPYGGSFNKTRWSTGSKIYQDIEGIENFTDFKMLLAVTTSSSVVSVENLNAAFAQLDGARAQQQYNDILGQYDNLINDSSYKGINLLKNDKLKVNFNEKGSSYIEVEGKDMTSKGLGLNLADWAEKEGVLQSVRELAGAVASLRSFAEDMGNNYSIITTRQDFTEKLINVLEEGADKLTLADMNEESANILALQLRQQLAVNSLSLASQASQSVLKLF